MPTVDMEEQKIELKWFENQNKRLSEKRRDEEMKVVMLEWSHAKSRLEEDIQRKKEHANSASKFEVRGYKRKSFKTKNFNYRDNPLMQESSSENEEDYGEETQDFETGGERMSNMSPYKLDTTEDTIKLESRKDFFTFMKGSKEYRESQSVDVKSRRRG